MCSKYIYNQIQTTIHKGWVAWYLLKFCVKLIWRALTHDLSKYSNVEAIPLSEVIDENRNNTYGSDAYNKCLDKLSCCLAHHYAINSHHPQHYLNGFADMTIMDRIEMCADWLASIKRHKDGCINQSVTVSQERFGLSNADREWLEIILEAMSSKIRRQPSPSPESHPTLCRAEPAQP
jgi:hypothetical protein